jgi:hypothetical protein
MESSDRSLARAGSIVLNEICLDARIYEFRLVIHLQEITPIVQEEFSLNNDDLWESRGGSEMH